MAHKRSHMFYPLHLANWFAKIKVSEPFAMGERFWGLASFPRKRKGIQKIYDS